MQDTAANEDGIGGDGSGGRANGSAGQGNGLAGSTTGGGGAKGTAGAGGALNGTSGGGGGKAGVAGAGGTVSTGVGGAKGGAGGTVSTGGTVNTGGGGAGGSVAGASGGTAGSSSIVGLSVQYKNLNANATDPYISCEILAKNAGPNSIAVSDLKVRYYFTDEPKKTNTFQNNFQHINVPGNQADLKVTQTVVGMAPTKPTADTYIEFSFSSSTHGALAPGEALDFAWQMQSANPATDTFTETNDYSFDVSKSAPADWAHVVLLQGSSPLWGAAP